MAEALPRLLKLEEVADYCNVSIHTVRSWRKRNLIKVIKLPGGSVRVRLDDLEAVIREDRNAAP